MSFWVCLSLASTLTVAQPPAIDRRALVGRHNVVLTALDLTRPLQVGNGEFAFGMDVTGLQTFAPFNTMSQWGWHSALIPAGQKVEDFEGLTIDTHGRPVRYPMADPKRPELSGWLASNPHRINLGRIGLVLRKKDGSVASHEDISKPRQELDLWHGIATSRFEIEGEPVTVTTACHPDFDQIGVKIDSPLIKAGRIAAFMTCPGNNPLQLANYVGEKGNPARFEFASEPGQDRVDFVRKIDEDVYYASLAWTGNASFKLPDEAKLTLKVLKAEYGAERQWMDVTDKISAAQTGNQLAIRVGLTLGGDPAPGLDKTLKVTYEIGGQKLATEVDDGQELRLNAAELSNRFTLTPDPKSKSFEFVCAFSPAKIAAAVPNSGAVIQASRKSWPAYWKSGGAIDLSGSLDPRWKELERRIVLSQYLMAVNESGSLPPQESGLVNNGWYGRFHFEMIWWHAAHWALWNRFPEMEGSVGVYQKFLASSKARAASQGYEGARWPKCTGPNGVEWPHAIHATLIWQQPHPIFFAELDYRAHPTAATLEKWAPVVEATADFMASYAHLDSEIGKYILGPPLTVVSENTEYAVTKNPTFELSYWRFGLRMAQTWRERMKEKPKSKWAAVLKDLTPLPERGGVYETHEGIEEMWTKYTFEHPALIGAYGMLPGDGVDRRTMARTFDRVHQTWNFNRTWGWDFPMMAMSAARLGQSDRAIDYLLHSSKGFQFDERGLATGGPFPYFPSNGGLLYAVAMMAAGWDGANKRHAPGFPNDGKWSVRWEGLSPAL